MSYIEKFGMTEAEFDAVMNEACDHFQSCAEQQAQQFDCDFDMHTEGRDPDERDDEGLEDDPQEGDDNADDFEPMEDQWLDSAMEDRMSGFDF